MRRMTRQEPSFVGSLIGLVLIIGIVLLSGFDASGSRLPGLLQELQHRSTDEGLALINIGNTGVVLKAFDGSPNSIPNAREWSEAFLSATGDVAVWEVGQPVYPAFRHIPSPPCPSPLIVESINGKLTWQLPGDVRRAWSQADGHRGPVSVSDDGQRVAFYGTYMPPCTCGPASGNDPRWTRGLQYADHSTNSVMVIQGVGEIPSTISWSADGNAIAYDSKEGIYIYDLRARLARVVATGTAPAFSPDGRWLAYKSAAAQAVVLDLRTNETKVLHHGKKINFGVHWSPDSRYVMFAESHAFVHDLINSSWMTDDATRKMVIYRIEDGATVSGDWLGVQGAGDHGYCWVKDYRAFLKAASVPLTVHVCQQPTAK